MELLNILKVSATTVSSIAPEQFYVMLETINGMTIDEPMDVEALD